MRLFLPLSLAIVALQSFVVAQSSSYLGFDRNDYPGDENLRTLRETFSFAGYWLNHPPGAAANAWTGKRQIVQSAGFGFLVLFNGRLFVELKDPENARALAYSDSRQGVAAAQREGFPEGTIIFLDQEEGGRLLPEQRTYLHEWVEGVNGSQFRAGVYCSGIAAKEAGGASVITADDIRQNAGGRKIVYFVTNDACPPSPGCAFSTPPPIPGSSGISFAEVWQFVQSPRRRDFASGCSNYSSDGNCYPPGLGKSLGVHVDVEAATTADPSHARAR
jgi:Domain of unknown function (DUF1906)